MSQNNQQPKIIWLNVLVFSITFVIALVGVPLYAYFKGFDTATIVAFILATGFCGMSITAGYHRLWSHNAYQASFVVRVIYAVGGAFAIQNSALHWCSDHRVHHQFVDDNDKDPYSAKRGFWYSHIGWMLREYQPLRYDDYRNAPDLMRDPVVMWQHKHYLLLVLLTNFGIPFIFGWLNGDFWGSVLLLGFMRLVVSHHVTFFINSLAHMWGSQPYSEENTAKDNAWVALITYGEGYHNFHHAFQYDYRNGIKWWQFDPTKWFIKLLSVLGLAHNLKKIPEEKIIKSIAEQQLCKAKKMIAMLYNRDKEAVIKSITHEYELLIEHLTRFYEAKKAKAEMAKNTLIDSAEKHKVVKHYQMLKADWQQQQRHWQQLLLQYV